MKETQKIYEAIRLLGEIDMNFKATRAKALLQEFIIANDTVKKSGKVDIWKFVGKGKYRPVMTGVCYIPSKKVAVASDAMVLLISRPDYVEREMNNAVRINGASEPCGIYRKDGTAVTKEDHSSDYPDCFKIIPEDKLLTPAKMTGRDKVAVALKEAKIALKAKAASHAMIQGAEGIWMRPVSAKLMLSMPRWEFMCAKDQPGVKAISYRDDNYTALFMPVMPPVKATRDTLLLVEWQEDRI